MPAPAQRLLEAGTNLEIPSFPIFQTGTNLRSTTCCASARLNVANGLIVTLSRRVLLGVGILYTSEILNTVFDMDHIIHRDRIIILLFTIHLILLVSDTVETSVLSAVRSRLLYTSEMLR